MNSDQAPVIELEDWETLVPHTRMRRAIAKAMTRSAGVPQFTLQREVQIGRLLALRTELKGEGSAASVTDMLVASVARALRGHPGINSSYRDDGVLLSERIDVGLAIALDQGLIVVRIADADKKSLDELAFERARLDKAARNGELSAHDVSGVTFTISNLGTFGVTRFTALVNPPQAAILAVGAPSHPSGAPHGSEQICLSLSCDHRVVDGAPAASFLASLAEALEGPDWLRCLQPISVAPETDG